MIYESITKCRVSKKRDLVSVGKFGGMALTGTFPKSRDQKVPHLPFEVVYSKSSKLLQLKHNYNPKVKFLFFFCAKITLKRLPISLGAVNLFNL